MDSCIKDDFEKFLEMMSTLYLRKDVKKLCWGLLFNDLPGIVWCEGGVVCCTTNAKQKTVGRRSSTKTLFISITHLTIILFLTMYASLKTFF